MNEVYILNYNTKMIYHFSIDLSNCQDNENNVVEAEIKAKGFNLDEVSYMIADGIIKIEKI